MKLFLKAVPAGVLGVIPSLAYAQAAAGDMAAFQQAAAAQQHSGMNPFGAIAGLGMVLPSVILGALLIAFGQVFLAIRETAINTRQAGDPRGQYGTLQKVAGLVTVLGWIVIVVGVVAGVMALFR